MFKNTLLCLCQTTATFAETSLNKSAHSPLPLYTWKCTSLQIFTATISCWDVQMHKSSKLNGTWIQALFSVALLRVD